jgi:quercetin dioxygenase-like cupin family protein
MKTGTSAVAIVAAVVGIVVGVGLDRAVGAQQEGIKRTMLQTIDNPASDKHQAVMGLAELAPGASSGKHRHHGVELGYVLEGTVIVEHDGRPTATLKAGETFRNDGPHNAKNGGPTPAKILAVYLVEKGKPLAEPVQ